jgi:hypothetical protein
VARLTATAYAKHRKERGLRGTSHVAVLKAIDTGRLGFPAVVRVGRGWEIDPDLADQQWADATHPADRGTGHHRPRQPDESLAAPAKHGTATPKRVPPRAESEALTAALKAKMIMLELQEKEGKLVYREDFEAAQAAVFNNLTLKASGLSKRIKTDIPHLTHAEVEIIQARIDDVFREIADMDFEELDL